LDFQLTDKQSLLYEQSFNFTASHITPFAAKFDREKRLPKLLIAHMAEAGYLAPIIDNQYGGLGHSFIEFAIINENIGQGCSSARSLITVQSMVAYAIRRWGSKQQKTQWLEELALGRCIAAFALSEPTVGSNGAAVTAQAEQIGENYRLNGHKKWISFAQIADVFLLICHLDNKPIACLVERDRPGVSIDAINDISGCRASQLANIHLDNCKIPKENIIGGVGFGFSAVALSALSIGRLSVAMGCVGMANACMSASFSYAGKRQQFDQTIGDFQLIRRLLAQMKTQVTAARLLGYQGAQAKDLSLADADEKIMLAKYFAAPMACDTARDAIQVHGAVGCCEDHLTSRFYRDAKVMEIIEGSNEMHQLLLGKSL
jgi:hypothetical protein